MKNATCSRAICFSNFVHYVIRNDVYPYLREHSLYYQKEKLTYIFIPYLHKMIWELPVKNWLEKDKQAMCFCLIKMSCKLQFMHLIIIAMHFSSHINTLYLFIVANGTTIPKHGQNPSVSAANALWTNAHEGKFKLTACCIIMYVIIAFQIIYYSTHWIIAYSTYKAQA